MSVRILVKSLSLGAQKCVVQVSKRHKVTFGHPLDHATGLEKREMLARLAGCDDPFTQAPIKGGRCATRDKPYEVPSVNDFRIVGCICCDEAHSINFMTVYKGHPTRCECGYWFCLVPATPL